LRNREKGKNYKLEKRESPLAWTLNEPSGRRDVPPSPRTGTSFSEPPQTEKRANERRAWGRKKERKAVVSIRGGGSYPAIAKGKEDLPNQMGPEKKENCKKVVGGKQTLLRVFRRRRQGKKGKHKGEKDWDTRRKSVSRLAGGKRKQYQAVEIIFISNDGGEGE